MKKIQRLFFVLATSLLSITASANTLSDFEAQVASHKGKVIYVDFWASWCVPCRKSFPWMNDIQQKYADKNFTVLSVNLDAKTSLAEEFLLETPANFPIFYDPKGKVARAFKLKGMPSSFIINKAGKVVSSHVGFTDEKKVKYQAEIEALLAE